MALLFVTDFSSLKLFTLSFEKELMRLRYHDDSLTLVVRNHFVSLDFLRNTKEHLLDITHEIYNCQTALTIIDKAAWFKKIHGIHNLLIAPISVKLPYINKVEFLNNYANLIKYFPAVSIVNIVRPNWALKARIGTNLDTSHLGFVLKYANQLTFWHATSIHKMVVCEPLNAYITKQLQIDSICGINVQSIQGIN